MSVQIKISYEHDAELQDIVQKLRCPGMKVRPAMQKGQFKRAYIKFQDVDITEKFRYNEHEQTFA